MAKAGDMRQMQTLLDILRRDLRAGGHTMRSIAAKLGVGEATVKRWLAGKGLTLDRLDQLCALADVSFADLVEAANQPPGDLAQHLTLAQERALTEDSFLSFLFFLILGGWSPNDVVTDFDVPQAMVEGRLRRLERLALIDRRSGDRVRARIDRSVAWRRGPMRAHFEQHMKRQFFEMDFASPEAMYTSEVVKLSPLGVARLGELIEQVRLDLQSLSDEDRRHARLPGQWYAVLFAARELDTAPLRARAKEAAVDEEGG